jgi:hypothetical protein
MLGISPDSLPGGYFLAAFFFGAALLALKAPATGWLEATSTVSTVRLAGASKTCDNEQSVLCVVEVLHPEKNSPGA